MASPRWRRASRACSSPPASTTRCAAPADACSSSPSAPPRRRSRSCSATRSASGSPRPAPTMRAAASWSTRSSGSRWSAAAPPSTGRRSSAGPRIALRDWPPAFDDRYRLQFAAGVAARHERNAGEIAVPGPRLARRAAGADPRRRAHAPRPAVARTPGRRRRTRSSRTPRRRCPRIWAPRSCRSCSSPARWRGCGRSPAAPPTRSSMQQRVARAFVATFEDAQVSFQLSEWFRLSGALGDAEAFARAETFLAKLEATGGLTPSGAPYVHLARARARVELGQSDAETRDRLDALSRRSQRPRARPLVGLPLGGAGVASGGGADARRRARHRHGARAGQGAARRALPAARRVRRRAGRAGHRRGVPRSPGRAGSRSADAPARPPTSRTPTSSGSIRIERGRIDVPA